MREKLFLGRRNLFLAKCYKSINGKWNFATGKKKTRKKSFRTFTIELELETFRSSPLAELFKGRLALILS